MPKLTFQISEDSAKRMLGWLSELDPFQVISHALEVDIVSSVGNNSQCLFNVEQVGSNGVSIDNLGSEAFRSTSQRGSRNVNW
jgi:hypothetical protein